MVRISYLITHFNRPQDIQQCIEAIQMVKSMDDEIVVSDDASSTENLNLLKELSIDTLVVSDFNEGLAANINKGLQACKGNYIIYCQEYFLLNPKLKHLLPQFIEVLNTGAADLIRFSSYFKFNKTLLFNENLQIIPKFSFANFTQNFYRYSDHPFIVSNTFHIKYGYYLEQTSGRYGETEYGMRIANTEVVIAITTNSMASNVIGSESTLINEIEPLKFQFQNNKYVKKYVRAFRMYFEWLFYKHKKRGLLTYKNGRKL